MEKKITILDNEYASMWYYPEKKIVHHQWKKPAYGDAFREVLLKGTETIEKYGIQKWLSDDRSSGALHSADKEWADNVWIPRVINAGWKYWAMIMPEQLIAQLSVSRVIKEQAHLGLDVNIFSDPDEALQWLENK